jgi:cell division transport system permease protein
MTDLVKKSARETLASEGVVPKRKAPLVPRDSLAGGALLAVIGIMTFLACFTAGVALTALDASRAWRSQVLSQLTIQIKPHRDVVIQDLVDKAVTVASQSVGVAKVHAYTAKDSEDLLYPWLGSGLDLSLLPVPRIITVEMQEQSSPERIAGLRDALSKAVPAATLDDHRMWAARIGTMANAVVVVALFVLGLMVVTMAAAIGFATRGAMAGTREIIEVLHFVGASDAFIARQFQGHFLRVGLQGALIGVLSAVAFFFTASALSNLWASTGGGKEVAAMFGSFSLPPLGYFALVALGGAVALLTAYVSRGVVYRFLDGLR